MKLMVVIPTLADGGAERTLSVLTKEWAKSHQVVLVLFDATRLTYGFEGRLVDLRLPASVGFLRPAVRIYNAFMYTVRLYRLMQREHPDRIISFLPSANFPCIVAAALSRRLDRLWVSEHGNPSHHSLVFRILVFFLYRFAARIVPVSADVARVLESMNVPRAKLSVIPNPVQIPDRLPAGNPSTRPHPKRYVLAVGRLHPVKGFERLLGIFHTMDRSDLDLVIIGEGPERTALLDLARDLRIQDRVHFKGWIEEIDEWYQQAECLVLTSRHEALPNVLLEAMANGCPTASFNCKYGPADITAHGRYGLLVPDGDIDDLAKAIAPDTR